MPKKRKFWRLKLTEKLWTFFLLGALGFSVGAVFLIFVAEKKLASLVGGGLGESFSTRIYSAPHQIYPGSPDPAELLLQRISQLGYKPVRIDPEQPGEFKWDSPRLKIYLKGFKTPVESQGSALIEIRMTSHGVGDIRDSYGLPLSNVFLEPELTADLSGPKKVRRQPATYQEIPPVLLEAVVALEDIRFFSHWGIDLRSVARAAYNNLFRQGPLQGGSTITQQLVKNLFLTPERSLKRKILEAFLAAYLDLRKSKQEILTLYLNQIYFGQDGPVSVSGVKAAAQFYFGRDLSQLNVAECATLAGMIRSPYRYNPISHPENSRLRRNFVLRRLKDNGTITFVEFMDAVSAPLTVRAQTAPPQDASDYFISEVMRKLMPVYGEDVLVRYGLKIYTTMDPLYQKIGVEAVKHGSHQAALVCLVPQTGNVLAVIGGRNYKESQFNRATQGRRQPGSAFKPFVYGAALEYGFTPSTFLVDEKKTYGTEESQEWAPRNFNRVYLGTVTVREALAYSINSATVDLAKKIGPERIIQFARRMGVSSALHPDLALALGSYEVTPLELTGAFAPFVNGGFQVSPRFIESVVDSKGEVVEIDAPDRKSVLDPSLSYLLTSLLRSVVEEGTAKNLKTLGWDHPAAGKTGTTNEGRDAWFIGYTPLLLTGVWVGDDKGRPVSVSGSKDAVPIWAKFMNKIYPPDIPTGDFEKPKEILTLEIDPESGKLARSGCPVRKKEIFLKGTEPKEYCPNHSGGIKGWFKRIFGGR